MVLKKMVDGVEVELSPEEEAALLAEWEAGEDVQPSLQDKLTQAWDEYPIELKARFAPLRAAVKLELDLGHVDVAQKIIELADIPEELEPIRSQLLSNFD